MFSKYDKEFSIDHKNREYGIVRLTKPSRHNDYVMEDNLGFNCPFMGGK